MQQPLTDEQTPRSAEDRIIGRNAVTEALRSGRALDSLWIAKGERGGSIGPIRAMCHEQGIPVKEVDVRKLTAVGGANHQGVVAFAALNENTPTSTTLKIVFIKGIILLIIIISSIHHIVVGRHRHIYHTPLCLVFCFNHRTQIT